MINEVIREVTNQPLYVVLTDIDVELAAAVRKRRCPHCGGPLHDGSYQRKPKNAETLFGNEVVWRQSLCCGREGCRKRTLPPSCIFQGARWYAKAIILVAVALKSLDNRTAEEVEEMLGVPTRTLREWIGYFRGEYLKTRDWLVRRLRLNAAVRNDHAVADVLRSYLDQAADVRQALVEFLRFMSAPPPPAVAERTGETYANPHLEAAMIT